MGNEMETMQKKLDLILGTMATKSDIHRLEKEIKDIRHYVEHIDTELQEHRHDSEVHRKVGV